MGLVQEAPPRFVRGGRRRGAGGSNALTARDLELDDLDLDCDKRRLHTFPHAVRVRLQFYDPNPSKPQKTREYFKA